MKVTTLLNARPRGGVRGGKGAAAGAEIRGGIAPQYCLSLANLPPPPQYCLSLANLPHKNFGIGGQNLGGEAPEIRRRRRRFRKFFWLQKCQKILSALSLDISPF